MSKIAFECVDASGKVFHVKMSSDSTEIEQVVAATVQAYQRQGFEVISATRVEEMVVDVNLYTQAVNVDLHARSQREIVPTPVLAWFAGRGGRMMEKGALLGALALSVIGFDDGFSMLSVSHHLAMIAPAVGHIFHHVV
jgi:hypothetical protein